MARGSPNGMVCKNSWENSENGVENREEQLLCRWAAALRRLTLGGKKCPRLGELDGGWFVGFLRRGSLALAPFQHISRLTPASLPRR